MKHLLVTFLLASSCQQHGAKSLTAWANSTVYSHFTENTSQGSYDLCYEASKKRDGQATGLDSNKYPANVVNACAIILIGEEY